MRLVWRQWSTRPSGPLAGPWSAEKALNRQKSKELVVHFVEWTTGWAVKRQKATKKAENQGASGPLCLVDHWLGQGMPKSY